MLAGVLCAVVSVAPSGAQAQTGDDPPVLRAQGEAEIRVAPDLAVVRIGAAEQAPTAQAAQQSVNRAVDAVLDAVRGLGIEDGRVQTVQVTLTPVYSSRRPGDDQDPRIVGYRASNTVSVRLDDTTDVAAVIDAALDAGANRLEDVSFGLQDDEAARQQALRRAVEVARARADAMAAALGLAVGPVVSVTEEPGSVRLPAMESFRAMAIQADVPTQVAPGEVAVTASVSIVYRLDAAD